MSVFSLNLNESQFDFSLMCILGRNNKILFFQVRLFRYEDVLVGPRKLPVTGNALEGKVEMPTDGCLEIDFEKNAVKLVDGSNKFELGDQITYFVE